ncbi:MAG TPA: STAS domain-containing protein [Bacteroidales bacterium]|nr:STAS domain-containing protein [Bacteroidales bacterium]HNS46639.1 STAS domain-containing protein [Bacteroidales bacterium]
MSEQFTIRKEIKEGQLLLVLNGRLDAYWSDILGEEMDTCIHDGHYSISVDTAGITYVSSAGLRIFLNYYKKLKEIQGSFVLMKTSPQVRTILEMAGLMQLMQGKEHLEPEEPKKQTGESLVGHVRYVIQPFVTEEGLKGWITGSAGDLTTRNITPASVRSVDFHSGLYGAGIGAFGDDFGDYCHRMGEFIGLGDVIACLPTDGRKKPDYLSRVGRMVPRVNLLYGLLFEGKFSHKIRFEMTGPNKKIYLSDLIAQLHGLIPFGRAGMVMVAETTGLVGAALSADPLSGELSNPLFSFPEIKQQVTVTTEPEFSGRLTVTTGMVALATNDEAYGYGRPLKSGSPFLGHLHTAVFSYHPLKKQWDDPQEVIHRLVEEHQFETILHLLNDERPHAGIGESEFQTGTVWMGEIETLEKN